jgi:antirestriction protein ArdC
VASLQEVPEVHHKDLNHAFCAPVADQINMPPLPRFSCSPAYYKTFSTRSPTAPVTSPAWTAPASRYPWSSAFQAPSPTRTKN